MSFSRISRRNSDSKLSLSESSCAGNSYWILQAQNSLATHPGMNGDFSTWCSLALDSVHPIHHHPFCRPQNCRDWKGSQEVSESNCWAFLCYQEIMFREKKKISLCDSKQLAILSWSSQFWSRMSCGCLLDWAILPIQGCICSGH